jgi:hypothetical protein
VERPDRFRRALLDGVRHAHDAGHLPIHGHEHRRLPLDPERLRLLGPLAKLDAELSHECAVAERQGAALHRSADAFARDALEALDLDEPHATFLGSRHDRGREGVLAPALETRG